MIDKRHSTSLAKADRPLTLGEWQPLSLYETAENVDFPAPPTETTSLIRIP